MYDFVDLSNPAKTTHQLATDEMYINGQPLSSLVDGYRHLTVSGRGIVGRKVNTSSVLGRRGVWVDDYSDSERVLEIKYKLKSSTSAGLRDSFAKLNKILRTHNPSGFLEITFKDEPKYTYYGYLSEADDIEENSLSIVSKFSLLIPDGYKKKNASSSIGKVTLDDAIEVLPEKITVTPTATTNNVKIANGSKILSFKGTYKPTSQIVITFGHDEITAVHDGRNILSELERYSPLEKFTVKNGDTITAVNATVNLVEWRDERL